MSIPHKETDPRPAYPNEWPDGPPPQELTYCNVQGAAKYWRTFASNKGRVLIDLHLGLAPFDWSRQRYLDRWARIGATHAPPKRRLSMPLHIVTFRDIIAWLPNHPRFAELVDTRPTRLWAYEDLDVRDGDFLDASRHESVLTLYEPMPGGVPFDQAQQIAATFIAMYHGDPIGDPFESSHVGAVEPARWAGRDAYETISHVRGRPRHVAPGAESDGARLARAAVARHGSARAAAIALGVSPYFMSMWASGKSAVPADAMAALESDVGA